METRTQKTHTTKTQDQLDDMYDTILELWICTFEELELVIRINGFNEKTMNDIVYAREGYQTLDQYLEYLNDRG